MFVLLLIIILLILLLMMINLVMAIFTFYFVKRRSLGRERALGSTEPGPESPRSGDCAGLYRG